MLRHVGVVASCVCCVCVLSAMFLWHPLLRGLTSACDCIVSGFEACIIFAVAPRNRKCVTAEVFARSHSIAVAPRSHRHHMALTCTRPTSRCTLSNPRVARDRGALLARIGRRLAFLDTVRIGRAPIHHVDASLVGLSWLCASNQSATFGYLRSGQTYTTMHWASLSSGLEWAYFEDVDKSNASVQISVARGCVHSSVFYHETPAVFKKWLKVHGNKMNQKAHSTGVNEVWANIPSSEAGWNRKRKSMSWDHGTMTHNQLEAKQFAFISALDFYPFKSMREYRNVKQFHERASSRSRSGYIYGSGRRAAHAFERHGLVGRRLCIYARRSARCITYYHISIKSIALCVSFSVHIPTGLSVPTIAKLSRRSSHLWVLRSRMRSRMVRLTRSLRCSSPGRRKSSITRS